MFEYFFFRGSELSLDIVIVIKFSQFFMVSVGLLRL